MSLRVLRAGIDSLQVSFMGTLHEEIVAELDAARARAQAADEPVPFLVFPQEFMLMPSAFGKWKYRLVHPEVEILLVDSTKVPCASLRPTALGLSGGAVEGLWEWSRAALDQLGAVHESSVSRVDVCVDVQGWTPTVEQMRHVSTHLRFRPIYPNVDNPETFQFGRGPVVVRVYNKTVEIEVSKKGWMREVWAYCPDYDPTQDVWRIEVQLRRAELKRIGINTSAVVFNSPGSILDYVLRERVQLKSPGADQKVSRWPEHPHWTAIRNAAFDGRTVTRLPVFARLLGWDQLVTRFLGIAATVAAMRDYSDLLTATQGLLYAAEAQIILGKYDWDAEVEKRRRRLSAKG